jgi:hypothetical protein
LVLKRFGVAQPDRRVFRCAAGLFLAACLVDHEGLIQDVRREQMLNKSGGITARPNPYRL